MALAALPARAAVTYRASGTLVSANNACTAGMPAGVVADDILLLVVESENEAISLGTANGFVEVTNSPQGAGTAATAGSNRIAVFWKRALGGDLAPITADAGDHATCQIHAFSGAATSGNPWDVTAGGNDGAADDTSAVIPGATTTVANTLVVLVQGWSTDTTTGQCGAATNANLTGITERTDAGGQNGLGGGHCLITGAKATVGAYANTTLTLVTSSYKGAMSIALKPAILVTSVAVSPTTATILAGGIQTISATTLPTDAENRNVDWTKGAGCDASDTVSPASTLGDGVATTTFTAFAGGTLPRTCVLTATAADGSGFSATSSITVNAATPPAALTIGNFKSGTSESSDATIAPDGTADVDTFSIVVDAGPIDVTSATVTLSATATNLAEVFIHQNADCTTGTKYGFQLNPVSGANTFSLGTNISATTTETNYYVCVTAKGHASVTGSPAITGTVTNVLAGSATITKNDSAGATVAIDNTAPGAPTLVSATGGGGSANLTWTNPADTDLAQVLVVKSTASITATATDGTTYSVGDPLGTGTVAYVGGVVTSESIGGLTAGTWYFRVLVLDTHGNYSPASNELSAAVINLIPDGYQVQWSTRPVVSIINPMSGAVLTLPAKIQIRAFSPAGGGAFSPSETVYLSINGGAGILLDVTSKSANYSPVVGTSGVWTYTIPTGAYSAGSTITLRAYASNSIAGGPVYSGTLTVKIASKGDGNLLVRDNASQLCSDCHAGVMTHSSESTGTKQGSYATTCRDCHTPHTTTNLGLIRTQIKPPDVTQQESPRTVVFLSRTGGAVGGPYNAANNGICQVCHTQTDFYLNDGSAKTHETGTNCLGCHDHKKGLKGSCTTCHGDKTEARTAASGADSNFLSAPPDVAPGAAVFVAGGGEHVKHVTLATYTSAPMQCADCHAGAVHQAPNPSQTDIGYSVRAQGSILAANMSPLEGGLTSTWISTPSCTNWCHGGGLAAGGGTVATWSWSTALSLGCSSCHGAPPPVDTTDAGDHPQSIYCASCHGTGANPPLTDPARLTHVDGTINKPANGCTACHGVLAGLSGLAVDRTSATAAPGYDASAVETHGAASRSVPGVGAHIKHVNDGLMSAKTCGVCHAWPAAWDTTHADGARAWSWTAPATSAGVVPTYTSTSPYNCTNYCHSNAGPIDTAGNATAPVVKTISWTSTTALGCTDCHATGGATTTLSHAHQLHTTATTYGYTCEKCHALTAQSAGALATGGAVHHVNGGHDVNFNGSPLDQSAGTYAQAPDFRCSSTYCHSNGVDRNAADGFVSGPSIPWSTGSVTCASCHQSGSSMATRSHGLHVNNAGALGYIGVNYGCITCHDTVSDDGTIATGKYGQHVNGAVEMGTTGYSDGTANQIADGTCATNACHADGTETPGYTSVTWGGTDNTDNCTECHGKDDTTKWGAPWYANDTGSYDTRNSHSSHVASAADCVDCHAGTVDSAGKILTTGSVHLDLNGTADVSGTAIGSYTDATETCNTVTCHGSGSPQWGATLKCGDCHVGTGDVDNWNINDDVLSRIDATQWTGYGHGSTSTAGNSFAEWSAVAAADRCVYCHDNENTSAKHNQAANPFRLRGAANSTGVTAAFASGSPGAVIAVCLNCHAQSATVAYGVDPAGTFPKVGPATARIDTYHYGTYTGANHDATHDGGLRCWDCHDVHGDLTNLAMIGADTLQDGTDVYGLTGARSGTTAILTSRAPGGYATATSPYSGVCQVCHTATSVWLANGTGQTHKTNDCMLCHKHNQTAATDGFKGAGDCLLCHEARAGSIPRAAIMGPDPTTGGNDFIRASRHVSNGGTATPIVKNVDCILCHAEGAVTSTETSVSTVTSLHGADSQVVKTVDLRDVDSASGGTVAAPWPGARIGADVRAFTTGVNNDRDKMDTFCMNCHDANGASNICVKADGTIETSTTGACSRRLTPFNPTDTRVNAYDSAALNALRTRVLDVKSQFNSGNLVGKSFASHHNLNQFTRRYGNPNANWLATAWTAYVTKEGQTLNGATVRETAGLHCSDCHLNEANAHGTQNTWYMLASASFSDATADAKFTGTGLPGGTDHCFRCHNSNAYGQAGTISSTASRTDAHDGDCSRIAGADVQGNTGAALGMDNTGTDHQVTCLMCHAGGGLGWIHGMNSTYKPVNGTNTSKTYRFQGGGGTWRWYSPISANPANATEAEAMWEGNTSNYGCYTLGTGSAPADVYGGCTHHGIGGNTGNATNYARPLEY